MMVPGCGFFDEKNSDAKRTEGRAYTSFTANGWIALSQSLFQQKKFLESIAAAQTAIYLKQDAPEAYNNIGAAYAALHLWDPAIQAAQQALSLKPDFTLAQNNLAWAREQKRLGVH